MTTYKKFTTVLGLYAIASLAISVTPLVLNGMVATLWQTAMIIGLPIVMLGGAWLFVGATDSRHSLDDQTESERGQATGAIYAAGAVLLVSQALAVLKIYGLLDAQASDRLFGFGIGVFTVILGNATPKVVFSQKTLELRKLTAQAAQAAGRFSGISLMLAGIGTMVAWAFLSHSLANAVTITLTLIAVIASFVRFQVARKA
ncbi:MAG: hypothetical protein JJ850_02125 [Kordiimonadaceae bacterium]|nr:hypothetical protein [Kordiimonadaceae bacterium]MBO6567399.1 hypothetical protein [Kordiimonadaceae bacterium]MBO6963387.1 hypothetical protein [Kordiimonadaceae bacterium]